jgi:hypothetical protein
LVSNLEITSIKQKTNKQEEREGEREGREREENHATEKSLV